MSLKGRRPLKVASASSTATTTSSTITSSVTSTFTSTFTRSTASNSHLTRSLASLLSKHNFEFSSLDSKPVHLISCFPCHFRVGIFNKGKSLWLLRVVVSWNVNIPNFSNLAKGPLQISSGCIGRYVSHQEGDSRRPFLTASTLSSTAGWRSSSSSSSWRTIRTWATRGIVKGFTIGPTGWSIVASILFSSTKARSSSSTTSRTISVTTISSTMRRRSTAGASCWTKTTAP
mmetsp:Transcript_19163/g.47374  ORF Transcript_19163/g.47374 Transcript_19163/m.47374 type:complete len:231 (+) Transcript_19163:831-1523(+)